jgi:ATP-binding cassette subfamily B protein
MKYTLNRNEQQGAGSVGGAVRKFLSLITPEKKVLLWALVIILLNAGLNLSAPYLIGRTVDDYIQTRQYRGVLVFSGYLLAIYLAAVVTRYLQTLIMGSVGQRVLFTLRNAVFSKLQELPIAFFNENKTGDLISRINSDTDKLNQFFSQSLMQFVGNVFMILGAGILIVSLHIKLGAASLVPAVFLLGCTQLLSGWVKRKNFASLQTTGGLSAQIQESLNNFKVIVAFSRRDYFREKFNEANERNFEQSVGAGLANVALVPIYDFCATIAQLIVLAYGIHLIAMGEFTFGMLISFLAYTNTFYTPLRQMAALWASFQSALAAWDRISEILALTSDLGVAPSEGAGPTEAPVMRFDHVSFRYPGGQDVLHDVHLTLERSKTYALVGPTGGGKTTTASLMARLYDPTEGTVLLDGRDIRSYTPRERTDRIGFILQEPILFDGTVRENIFYGNERYAGLSDDESLAVLNAARLDDLLSGFDQGLETPVSSGGDTMSLGQRQLIAFIRAVLRKPELLILDEATANIDTVTEQLLERALRQLPEDITQVVIAHRLNTIENADEIFFVNAGAVTEAGSLEHAVNMLLEEKRES